MPTRVQIHTGTAAHSRPNPISVNEVVSALQRKLTAHSVDLKNISPSSTPPRRPSFSMDSILHPKKDKKHDDKDHEPRDKKRGSIMTRHTNKSKDRGSSHSPRIAASVPARFEMIIESPPLVMYGNVSNSTGALLSGRLKLVVADPTGEVRLDTFTMLLKATISSKKPVSKDCDPCTRRIEQLKTWTFLSEPKTFLQNKDNQFPYSFLLPGQLPATTNSQLGSIEYSLTATAKTSHGETIELVHPLRVLRAIQPGPEKASIRIFPPTNLTGRVQLPPIVHPIGTFPVKMSLSGIVEKKAESQTRWRLRKLSWRIEEHCKVISTPCAKHSHKVSEGKSILHSDTRTLGNDELKSGWKTDFDTIGGEINAEFEASLSTRTNLKATCDVESHAGLEIKHNLVIELIVAEEFCPNRNTQLVTPTGAARVLRMQFNLIVTERAGMGISWDEEMPPVYEDVPDSPPGYGSSDRNDGAWGGAIMEDYHGPALEYEDLEEMGQVDPNAPPSYRNTGAVTRERPTSSRTNSSERRPSPAAGPSRRPQIRWTNDELGAEPPQYGLRARTASMDSNAEPQEDYGEGEAAAAASAASQGRN